MKVFCKIKKTSKYYPQGLNRSGEPVYMELLDAEGYADYVFHVATPYGGNNYRREDLYFFVQSRGKFIKIGGGR